MSILLESNIDIGTLKNEFILKVSKKADDLITRIIPEGEQRNSLARMLELQVTNQVGTSEWLSIEAVWDWIKQVRAASNDATSAIEAAASSTAIVEAMRSFIQTLQTLEMENPKLSVSPARPSIYHEWDLTSESWIVTQNSIDRLALDKKQEITLYREAILNTPGQFLGGDIPMTQAALAEYSRRLEYFKTIVANSETTSLEMLRLYRSNNVDYLQIDATSSYTAEERAVHIYQNLLSIGERRYGDTYAIERNKWSEVDAILADVNTTIQDKYDSLIAFPVTTGWDYPVA